MLRNGHKKSAFGAVAPSKFQVAKPDRRIGGDTVTVLPCISSVKCIFMERYMQRAQMKWASIGLLAIAISTQTNALELLCTGNSFRDNSGPMNNHFPLIMDDNTHLVHVWTWGGDASGTLDATEAAYSGVVVDKTGNQHSVTLDRYTGELLVMPFPLPQEGGKAEFMGKCDAARKLF